MEIAERQKDREEKWMEQERKPTVELADKERARVAEQHEAKMKEDRDKASAKYQQTLSLSLELA